MKNQTKKTTKPQTTKPAKLVTPTKGKGKNVTLKGKCAPKAKPAKPTKKTDKPVKATQAPKGKGTMVQPKKPKITKVPRRRVGIVNDTYYAKGKKLYEIPAESTLKRLKQEGVKRIQYGNGDAIIIK